MRDGVVVVVRVSYMVCMNSSGHLTIPATIHQRILQYQTPQTLAVRFILIEPGTFFFTGNQAS